MERIEWERQERRSSGCRKVFLFLALILIGLLIGAAVLFFSPSAGDVVMPLQEPGVSPGGAAAPDAPSAGGGPGAAWPGGDRSDSFGRNIMTSDTVRDIVAQCGDSVVRITAELSGAENPLYNDPFFRQFFGPPQPQVSQGSGFLFREDGYILTNNHVINGASQLQVYLASDEEPYEAKVIGTAPELDLAVIKIEGNDFPYLVIGDSDQVYVGDWVVAIGNPYGLDHTVTVGVISATGRPLTIDGTSYQNLFQTDAAINPGNSGGPMLNLNGEVIGINTAINAAAQGIGFAIPTSTVLNVLDDLEAGVTRARPWMGITMLPLTPEIRQLLDIDEAAVEAGVLIESVLSGAPADKAGLRREDVILAIDDQKITDIQQVQTIVLNHRVGDVLKINLYRNGAQMEFVVKLEASQNN
ncbi:MAG: trypsin-like peptidase domain-containing protein [Peptococcaceae bacterium]|nr:trypsin-like peptidase domain-containing protein [Peptococcaceae bacterium]